MHWQIQTLYELYKIIDRKQKLRKKKNFKTNKVMRKEQRWQQPAGKHASRMRASNESVNIKMYNKFFWWKNTHYC